MLERAVQLALENPVENDVAASLLAELQLRIGAIRQTLSLQRHGHAAMLGAAENRQDHADALREIMRDLARIARVLDIAFHMRTANLKVYSELLSRARCFIDAARPIEAVFIAYGAPVDFVARMESLIAAVNTAEYRKFGGKGEWINATATLTAQTREAIRTLRKLQVIHANYYRHQPGLAAAWKAATHIERAANRSSQSNVSTEALSEPDFHDGPDHLRTACVSESMKAENASLAEKSPSAADRTATTFNTSSQMLVSSANPSGAAQPRTVQSRRQC